MKREKGEFWYSEVSELIWITWERQRRNRTLSSAIGARLFEYDFKFRNIFLRYPFLLLRTLITFIKENPNFIFVQNPSIVLTLFALLYGKIFAKPVIVDSHNAGLFPFDLKKGWANKLAEFAVRYASFTIVTNDELSTYVKLKGGRPLIIPDPIPAFEKDPEGIKLKGTYNVLFICSWADDEPYKEVISAAKLIDKNICIYVTGNSRGKEKKYDDKWPDNVILTGFLNETDFQKMLFSSDLIIDLTTRNDCLVCGGYEAVSAEKPLILSNTHALKKYFYKGALYTENVDKDIAEKIMVGIQNANKLINDIRELKKEKIHDFARKRMTLQQMLELL